MMRDEMQIVDSIVLVDGCHGIYIPKAFFNKYYGSEYLFNADDTAMEYIGNTENMERGDYFCTWSELIDNAYFMKDGRKYSIEYSEHAGDLMAICYE